MNCLRLWRAEYTSVECPLGFRLSSPSSCYKFVRDRVTWHDAQRRCSSHNAHLLALETQTEQRLINNHLTHTRSTLTRNTPILEKLPRRLPPPPEVNHPVDRLRSGHRLVGRIWSGVRRYSRWGVVFGRLFCLFQWCSQSQKLQAKTNIGLNPQCQGYRSRSKCQGLCVYRNWDTQYV